MSFRPLTSNYLQKRSKTTPPAETYQESEYLRSLGEKQRPVAIKLLDGEVVRGWIEYFDEKMVRLTREGAPNLFIFKHDILYIAEENVHPNKPRAGEVSGPRRPVASGGNTAARREPRREVAPRPPAENDGGGDGQ